MPDKMNFSDWVNTFAHSDLGRPALKNLETAFPPERNCEPDRFLHSLREIVLSSCYAAYRLDRKSDPSKTARDADKKAMLELSNQRVALVTLSSFAKKYPRVATMAFGGAIIDLQTKGIRITYDDGESRDVLDTLDTILEAYLDRFQKPIPFLATGPFLKRFVYGCLLYNTPLDDGTHNHLPDVETMLLFDLVHRFRLSSRGIYRRDDGQPMPREGKPKYALAGDLVSATFSEKQIIIDGELARDRLRRLIAANPNVGIRDWRIDCDLTKQGVLEAPISL